MGFVRILMILMLFAMFATAGGRAAMGGIGARGAYVQYHAGGHASTPPTPSPDTGTFATAIAEILRSAAGSAAPHRDHTDSTPGGPAREAAPWTTAIATPAPPTPAVLRYVFPVRASRVSYGRYHHDYPATDIFCPVGSEFLAPTSGSVDFVRREDRWSPQTDNPAHRGGIAVAIIGDDGLRYYGSHLSAVAEGIEPGGRVEAGQLLGYTGISGNARGTPPHLHFGISPPTSPDDWQTRRGTIPPYSALRAWERGEMVTPENGG